jgi:hypothetical protein
MTCREFKHKAASLTFWELSRPNDKQILDHSEECPKCGAWLDRQQMLAVSMQTLQAQTAGREAGPQVERALLQVFRQEVFKTTQPVSARRSASIAFRLSRFFELGAYAAVAAAIVVGLFLGVRLLEHRSVKGSVQSQSAPASTAPVQQIQTAGNATVQQQPAAPSKREVAAHTVSQSGSSKRPSGAAASQTSDDTDYVALMFCDPLICSSDAQVVRMELPVAGTGDRDAQTQLADVVVGDDGVVRAMRIVDSSSN